MGRFKAEILSVTCLALLGLSMPVIAQESAQKEKNTPSTTTTKARHGIWKQVADGIWEAKVPRFSDDPNETFKPEFAVLRLTEDTYGEFKKDHVAFLNKYKIFSAKVKKLVQYSEAKPKTADPPNSYYYATVAHWPTSTALAQVYPGWSEPSN
jgi:hypothetical protein